MRSPRLTRCFWLGFLRYPLMRGELSHRHCAARSAVQVLRGSPAELGRATEAIFPYELKLDSNKEDCLVAILRLCSKNRCAAQDAPRNDGAARPSALCDIWLSLICAVCVALALAAQPGPAFAQGPAGSFPPTTANEGTCWQCHRQPNLNSPHGIAAANALCQDCHAKRETVREVNGQTISLQIREGDFGTPPGARHAFIACTSCHTTVARSPHKESSAEGCRGCHSNLAKHMAAGDAHLNVECAACHFKTDQVSLDSTTGRIKPARAEGPNFVAATDHTLASPVPCERCHTPGNQVRAVAGPLPPKDILCIGCHTSAPVVATPLSFGALAIFAIGLASSMSIWLSGSIAGKVGLSLSEKLSLIAERLVRLVFSHRLFAVLWTGFLDGILHRRILKESVGRWVAHSLILLPSVARFVLGIVTGVSAQFFPTVPLAQVLVDRDAPAIAFTNDSLALLVILGAGYAGYLRATEKQRRALTVGQDVLALVLLASIFVLGFTVEGAHIVVAQIPWDQALYAPGGAALAAMFSFVPVDWQVVYPILFFAHALVVALFVGYLPFSKFLHIIVALFVVAIRPAVETTEPPRHVGEPAS